ncbi:hypothetical protein KCU85_g3309, partial [Aureobasidium melanogenum]
MTSLHHLYPKYRAHASSRLHRRRYSPQSFVYTVLLFSLLGLAGYLYRSDLDIQHSPQSYSTLHRRDVSSFASSDEECRLVHKATDQCHYITKHCPAEDPGFYSYLSLFYCSMPHAKPIAFLILVSWLGLLFSTIGIAASDFFCINLSTIATILGMSESMAGVTFLAFGNGSPDVFSTFAAFSTNSSSLAIGELFGAAGFITAVVAGSMALVRPFRVAKKAFIRDVGFFTVAAAFSLSFLWDGKLHLWECIIMVVFYLFYVAFVVVWHWWMGVRRRRRERNAAVRGHFLVPGSEEVDAEENYHDADDEETTTRPSFSRGPSADDFSILERGDTPTIIEPYEDEDDDEVRDRWLGELKSNMRLTRPGPSSRRNTLTPIRPSLVGALEFQAVLKSLQKARSHQTIPMHTRRYSDDPTYTTAQQQEELSSESDPASRPPFHPTTESTSPTLERPAPDVFKNKSGRTRAVSANDAAQLRIDPRFVQKHTPRMLDIIEDEDNANPASLRPASFRSMPSGGSVRPQTPEVTVSDFDDHLANPWQASNLEENLASGHSRDRSTSSISVPIIDVSEDTMVLPSKVSRNSSPSHSPRTFGKDLYNLKIPASNNISPNTSAPSSPFPAYYEPSSASSSRPPSLYLPPASVSVASCPLTHMDDEREEKPLRWWPYRILPPPLVLLYRLFPTIEHWRDKNWWERLLAVIAAPSMFLLIVTLPVVESNREEVEEEIDIIDPVGSRPPSINHRDGESPLSHHSDYVHPSAGPGAGSAAVATHIERDYLSVPGERDPLVSPAASSALPSPTTPSAKVQPQYWNRWLTIVQLFLAPLLIVVVIYTQYLDETDSIKPLVRPMLISLLVSVVLLIPLLLTTTPTHRPKPYNTILSMAGFVVSIAWISTIAAQVVAVLKALAVIMNMSHAIMGLTIFAVGNSLGDLVADITVARLGYPIMALSACLGGPMLNILLGIGLSGSWILIRGAEHRHAKHPGKPIHFRTYEIQVGQTLIVSGVTLLVTLIGLLIAVPLNKWVLSRKIGWVLIGVWCVSTTINVILEVLGIGESGSEEKRSMTVSFGSRRAYSSTGSQPYSHYDDYDTSYEDSINDHHDHPGAYSTSASSESDISPNDSASIPAARAPSHSEYQSHPPSHERSRQERPSRKARHHRPPAEHYSHPESSRHRAYPEHVSTPSDPSELSARMTHPYDHSAYSARTSYHEGQYDGHYPDHHWPGQHAHYPPTMMSSTSSTSQYSNPNALAPYDHYAYAGQHYAGQASPGNPFAPPHAPSPQPGYTYDSYTGAYHQQRPEMMMSRSMAYLPPEMQYSGYPQRPYSVPQNMMPAMMPPGYHLYQPQASSPVPDEKPAKAEKKEEPPPAPPAPPAPPPPTAEEIKKKMEEEAALQAENLVKALKALQAEEKATAAAAAEQQAKVQAESDKIATLLADFEKQRLAREEAAAAKAAKEKAEAEAKAAREKELADAATAARVNAEKEAAAAAALAKAENEKAIAEAKAEHEKKMAEAKAAADAAEAAKKAAEEELKKNAPAPDADKAPLKFTDAVDRSFTLPWHLVKTWKGMETLIRQAFVNIERIGPHVANGHYHLLGPNNEIILPQVWDIVVQPGWDIKMQLWPLPPDPLEEKVNNGIGGFPLDNQPIVEKLPKKEKPGRTQVSGSKSAGKRASVGPAPPPPPPAPVPHVSPHSPPPMHMPTILAGHEDLNDPIVEIVEEGKVRGGKPRSTTNGGKKKQVPAFTRWMLGGTTRPRPKGAEKPAAGVKSAGATPSDMDLPTLSATTPAIMVSPGEHETQPPASTHNDMVPLASTVDNLDITSPSSIDPTKSSAVTTPIMASSGGHTERLSTSIDGRSAAASTDGSGPSHRSSPDLYDLPPELKRLVVHFAEDSCLPNLRLVNKELNAITTKPFGERLLAERRFMLSEHSLQGLVDLTAHPDLGPCVRKILLNTHGFTEQVREWPETIGKQMAKSRRRATWKFIKSVKQKSTGFVGTEEVVDMLSQALTNIKKHGQRVTLGIFDDVVYRTDVEDDVLRKCFGFDELWEDFSPAEELHPGHWTAKGEDTFEILLEAIAQSKSSSTFLELDLAMGMRDPRSNLDEHLHLALVGEDGKIPRDLDICIKAGLDWTFRFFRRDTIYDGLVFDYEGTINETCREDEVDPDFLPDVVGLFPSQLRYDYGSGTCSLYSRCVLGRLNHAIKSEDMTEIRISSCASEAHFLVYGICELGKNKLQELVLTDVHLFGPGVPGFIDEENKPWPWLDGFLDLIRENCPNLRSLTMERVFFHAEDKPGRAIVVEECRTWQGVDGVLTGLTSLISEMTALDREQRQRWLEGKIDSNGNDIAETSEH